MTITAIITDAGYAVNNCGCLACEEFAVGAAIAVDRSGQEWEILFQEKAGDTPFDAGDVIEFPADDPQEWEVVNG